MFGRTPARMYDKKRSKMICRGRTNLFGRTPARMYDKKRSKMICPFIIYHSRNHLANIFNFPFLSFISQTLAIRRAMQWQRKPRVVLLQLLLGGMVGSVVMELICWLVSLKIFLWCCNNFWEGDWLMKSVNIEKFYAHI